MAKTKLNSSDRELITKNVMKVQFAPLLTKLRGTMRLVATDIYNHVYDEPTRKRMEGLPEGWLRQNHFIRVGLGGTVRFIYFNGFFEETNGYYPFTHEREDNICRLVQDRHENVVCALLSGDHFLAITHQAVIDQAKETNARIERANATVKSTLAKYRYREDLVAAWPEVAQFLPDAPKPRQDIVLARDSINELLGLQPVETN